MRNTLTAAEQNIFQSLDTPHKIQDFLNTLKRKKGSGEPIVRSPRLVLQERSANCMEGALLAAAVLMHHGKRPFLLDLRIGSKIKNDSDHVVTLFKEQGCWGALSKTSHAVLRYREPIYKNMRELAPSYFHEYFTDDGKKNLRSFSKPYDVKKHFKTAWVTSEDDQYEIAAALDDSPHTSILTKHMEKNLRRADRIEIAAGKLTERP